MIRELLLKTFIPVLRIFDNAYFQGMFENPTVKTILKKCKFHILY